ncbi:glycosyltransferase [Roseobacter sp. HKCCD5988]|uniref:glycosyltransferase n=1 Tax=Roseobacter sp. HKCCD5988 TaxID=3120338 RepID=UPI0030EF2C33
MPRFTIITATRNSERTIQRCIDSIERQTFRDFEWIVIDGNSTDHTLEIIQNSSMLPNKLLIQDPMGIYTALNSGVDLASGDYTLFLHSDDFFLDCNYLKNYSDSIISSSGNISFLYSNVLFINNHDKVVREWHGKYYSPIQLFLGWMPPHTTVCVRTSFLKTNNILFSDEYQIASDYDWCLKCFKFLCDREIMYVKSGIIAMSAGGASNGSLKKYLRSFREDLSIARKYFGCFYFLTVLSKRIRKLKQITMGGSRV